MTSPSFPDRVVHTASANRGIAGERIDTGTLRDGGDYLIQVTGFNGASSVNPYTLRIATKAGLALPACSVRTFPSAGQGILGTTPPVNSLPAGVTTLFLWNQEWFGDTYGSAAASDVLSAMNTVAARADLGVVGAVIPVEGAVASAYSDWASNRCDPGAANAVASAIGNLVDSYRAIETPRSRT